MKQLFMSFVLAFALCTSASAYNYLTIASDAVESSVALNQLKKITFSGNELVVTSVDGTETRTDLATLKRLFFSDEPTAVRTVRQDALTFRNGHIVANGRGVLSVYNAGGALIRQQTVNSSRAEMNIATLPAGIYIVRLGNQTIKIAK